MNKVKHVKDPRCWEENEDYYLNRIVKAHTKDKVYYYQRVDGIIVKTEVTLYIKIYPDRVFRRENPRRDMFCKLPF